MAHLEKLIKKFFYIKYKRDFQNKQTCWPKLTAHCVQSCCLSVCLSLPKMATRRPPGESTTASCLSQFSFLFYNHICSKWLCLCGSLTCEDRNVRMTTVTTVTHHLWEHLVKHKTQDWSRAWTWLEFIHFKIKIDFWQRLKYERWSRVQSPEVDCLNPDCCCVFGQETSPTECTEM